MTAFDSYGFKWWMLVDYTGNFRIKKVPSTEEINSSLFQLMDTRT